MNNPFEYNPDEVCQDAYRLLIQKIETLRQSNLREDKAFLHELDEGKMLGVLIAEDADGGKHTLYAFSGQLGNSGFFYGDFVGPVFDYLAPDGYFKTNETRISEQNFEIAEFEANEFRQLKLELKKAEDEATKEVEAYKEYCRISKLGRADRRAAGVSPEAEAEMIRQSQFEKAELRRIKKRAEEAIAPYAGRLRAAELRLNTLKEKRSSDSESLQKWLFDNFKLLNANGESKSLSEIFAPTSIGVPPSGAGECCAPKLLHAAFMRGLTPVSIAEYWYGKPKGGELRIHGNHYPACRGKCLPVLSWMLQGLEVYPPIETVYDNSSDLKPTIIFENQWFCVVDKPSGLLSVPGKKGQNSAERWLKSQYSADKFIKMVHRLDQDTSGLLIAAFSPDAYKELQGMFARREVKKQYEALLEGDYQLLGVSQQGRISLPLSADWLDRPRQRVDFENGKEAITDYEFLGVEESGSRIIFYPHTGRTHQLRVTAASEHGLALPIVGDRLYGLHSNSSTPRLHLHASRIEFTSPFDHRHYKFTSPTPF